MLWLTWMWCRSQRPRPPRHSSLYCVCNPFQLTCNNGQFIFWLRVNPASFLSPYLFYSFLSPSLSHLFSIPSAVCEFIVRLVYLCPSIHLSYNAHLLCGQTQLTFVIHQTNHAASSATEWQKHSYSVFK